MLSRYRARLGAAVGFGVLTLPGPGGASAAQHEQTNAAVAIQGYAFAPDTVTAAAGDAVTWTNYDTAEHDVTASDGSFGSAPMRQGESFSVSFADPGSYTYLCLLHPEMVGTIEVAAHVEAAPVVEATPTTGAAVTEASPVIEAAPITDAAAVLPAPPVTESPAPATASAAATVTAALPATASASPEPGVWVLDLDRRLVLGAIAAALAVAVALAAFERLTAAGQTARR